MAISCEMVPRLNNGEESELYKELSKLNPNDRYLVNLIYAHYSVTGVDVHMDNAGYRNHNKQGQHRAKDVMQYFDVYSITREATKAVDVANRIGSVDSNGKLIDFTDSEDALRRAIQANQVYGRTPDAKNPVSGTVSFVVRKGDKFNIYTLALDSRNQINVFDMQAKMAMWNDVKQAFSTIGVDISNIDFNRELFNALNGKGIAEWAVNLRSLNRNDLLTKKEIRTLLSMDELSSLVLRLKHMFGTLDNAAETMYNVFQSRSTVSTALRQLMDATITNCKKLQGLDVAALLSKVKQTESNLKASSAEAEVLKILDDLNKRFDIDYAGVHKIDSNIRTLSEAATEAAFTLERQVRNLKAKQGITTEVTRMQLSVDRLMKEISSKRYFSGTLGFLKEALHQVLEMENIYLLATLTPGTTLERSFKRALSFAEIQRIYDGYKYIVDSLSNIENIISDESISDADKQLIKDQASDIKKFFETYEQKIKDLREDTMVDLTAEIIGDRTHDGIPIANIVKMAEADSTWYDNLYSVGRVSNPLIAAMGTLIRDAQNSRNQKLKDISIRIARATKALYKAGKNSTAFMYEPIVIGKDKKGKDVIRYYIKSDIDWESYLLARKKASRHARIQGLKGLDYDQAMQDWEDINTEDRVVDYKSGRTEKVPNSNYRKQLTFDNDALETYYNEIMQIKGEIGTLLPKYALKHYSPPLKRRTFFDALGSAKSGRDVAKAVLTKLKGLIVIREDDAMDARNGIILEGDEYGIRAGNMDNTPYRNIPIFFVNSLRDQDELLKDFSGAMSALAATAINYDCMNNVKDAVEFMGDFIKSKSTAARDDLGKKMVDKIETKGIKLFKNLVAYSDATNTRALIDGFIDKHLYGIKIKDVNKWTKFLDSLIKYTSIRSLTVNVKGFIANYLVGELQMLIESGAGEFYNPLDYAWAHMLVFGDNTLKAPGRVMDFLNNDTNSMPVLLALRFDPLNEIFDEMGSKRYFPNALRAMLSKDFTFIGYGIGEHLIHYVTMYSVLHNIKVRIDGKKRNNAGLKYTLYDAFEKGEKIDGTSELLLKNNVEYKDEEGNWVTVDDGFLDKIRDRIRYCNQTTHGSMNEEDKGLIHLRMLGRLVMNLRQWMIEHYSRRYRKMHWDDSLKQYREGYYTTLGRWAKGLLRFNREAALQWKDMDKGQKANVRRALTELFILWGILTPLSFALGEPEDHKKEFWHRMWIYQILRAIMEVKASTPLFIPMELTKMINSPMAPVNTVKALLYPVMGINHITETYKSGKHKGENKWLVNMWRYFVPFGKQIDDLIHMDEEDNQFKIFEFSMR